MDLGEGRTLPPRMKKRLRYITPSLPQSLAVRPVIAWLFNTHCWKTEK